RPVAHLKNQRAFELSSCMFAIVLSTTNLKRPPSSKSAFVSTVESRATIRTKTTLCAHKLESSGQSSSTILLTRVSTKRLSSAFRRVDIYLHSRLGPSSQRHRLPFPQH